MHACVHAGVCNVHVWIFKILYELSHEQLIFIFFTSNF